MMCFFGLFPWTDLPAEEGTAARTGWLAASLLCLGLAAFSLIRYHRLTGELRRRLSHWIGGLAAFTLAAVLAGLASRMGLNAFSPFQLTVALTYAAIYIYALWREVPCYLRPQEATS